MLNINEITAIENRYTADGAPSLGDAYDALIARWEDDVADREECLRLMFLAWYSCSEPSELTGLSEGPDAPLIGALFERLGGDQTTDAEAMFTIGTMASLFPYCCGNEESWTEIAKILKQRYHDLRPAERLSVGQFDERGAYGKYFAHMLASEHSKQGRSPDG